MEKTKDLSAFEPVEAAEEGGQLIIMAGTARMEWHQTTCLM
jgi:hypothetical protein